MSIKALEQEPTTKNDLGVDAVSRDEVCRYVAEFVNHEFSTREEEELIDNIITGIERMPSVTPQLSVPEVTALAEWTAKLTEANKSAYSQGYADGMKAQEPILDQIDEIITDALDKSTDQKESQTLRWVLDKISEVT